MLLQWDQFSSAWWIEAKEFSKARKTWPCVIASWFFHRKCHTFSTPENFRFGSMSPVWYKFEVCDSVTWTRVNNQEAKSELVQMVVVFSPCSAAPFSNAMAALTFYEGIFSLLLAQLSFFFYCVVWCSYMQFTQQFSVFWDRGGFQTFENMWVLGLSILSQYFTTHATMKQVRRASMAMVRSTNLWRGARGMLGVQRSFRHVKESDISSGQVRYIKTLCYCTILYHIVFY